MVSSEQCRAGKAIDHLEALKGTGHLPFYSPIPCRLLHPNRSCLENILMTIPESYLRSLTVYLPVYLAPAVLVHRKRLLSESSVVLPKVLMGVLRSSLFLTSVVSMAYAGTTVIILLPHTLFQGCAWCTISLNQQVNGRCCSHYCCLDGQSCLRRRAGAWNWHCMLCPEPPSHSFSV